MRRVLRCAVLERWLGKFVRDGGVSSAGMRAIYVKTGCAASRGGALWSTFGGGCAGKAEVRAWLDSCREGARARGDWGLMRDAVSCGRDMRVGAGVLSGAGGVCACVCVLGWTGAALLWGCGFSLKSHITVCMRR